MVHPKPATVARKALYAYLIGREHDAEALPQLVREYEKFKRNTNPGKVAVPEVPFQMLTSLPLTAKDWRQIARTAPWQMTRMNLNTFLRHGVFEDKEVTQTIAKRLVDPAAIAKARVFPYQLMAAYANVAKEMPHVVREALQDAMEISLKNVPEVRGKVYIFPDVSGSMHSSVTGYRQGATSAVRCIDVAALVAAAVLRKNAQAEVLPFESDVVHVRLNPRDSVLTNAQRLASLPAGGTNCSAPLRHLNAKRAAGDLVIYVSDNESWVDSPAFGRFGGGATATMKEWSQFRTRNPQAKMVCIDIQPYGHTQAQERDDIINVGGFSDRVFDLLADIAAGRHHRDHWVAQFERMQL
jgi:60 kDa SS-A/Ro ribonucleoprotein